MSKSRTRLSISAGLMLLIAHTSFAESVGCDRACLRELTTRYLAALVKHAPKAAKLAPTIRYTENAVETVPGNGLWQTATAIGKLQRVYVDAVQGQAAFFGLIEESAIPQIASIRLKVVDRQISEAELIIARKGVSLYDPETLIKHAPSDKPLPAQLRSTREQMLAAADSYFNGAQAHDPKVMLEQPGCNRFENGVKTTNNVGIDANGVDTNKDCAGTLADQKQIAAVVDRRYPIVDEDAGVVMGIVIFNRPPGAKRADGTLWPRLLLSEFFPIEQGRITNIYAAMFYLPAQTVDSNWRSDK
jgi:hypothetical protein